jgi:hypothetical protein
MSQTTSYLLRNAGNWYTHSRISEGYTNENQIIGAGSGFGNNVQTISIKFGSFINNFTFQYQQIAQNPRRLVGDVRYAWLGDTNWNDYSYGFKFQFNYKKIYFKINSEWVNSINYLWQNGNNKNNFNLFFNTIYIW